MLKLKNYPKVLLLCSLLCGINCLNALAIQHIDSAKIDSKKIYAYGLDADLKAAVQLLSTYDGKLLSKKDSTLKANFESRFKYATDQSDFLKKKDSPLNALLKIYVTYWRKALLTSVNHDQQLRENLVTFLAADDPLAKQLNAASKDIEIDHFLKKHVQSKGYQTTGFARTGKLIDLLIWKDQRDTTYTFTLDKEEIKTPIRFLDQFVTLGWEEYATFGRYYPGGWADQTFLSCVKKGYDLKSESFLIGYLAHEGRHFSDYKLFPNLTSAELEYRAKLTELMLADSTIYQTIDFFINNANSTSENPHSKANYKVMNGISELIFNIPFEKNPDRWKSLSKQTIRQTSKQLLDSNSKSLQKN